MVAVPRSSSLPSATGGDGLTDRSRSPKRRQAARAEACRGSGAACTSILCFGDSLTAGYHAAGKGFAPYGRTLKKELVSSGTNCKVAVCGMCGLTAREMVQHMQNPAVRDVTGYAWKGLSLHLRSKPDLVVIMVGTNDIGRGFAPKAILKDIAALHAECHKWGVATVAVAASTVASGPSRLCRDNLAKLLQRWASATPGCSAFIDLEELVSHSGRALWDGDGLHLSPTGSRVLGQRLVPYIKDAMA